MTSGMDGPAPDIWFFPSEGKREWATLVTVGLSGFMSMRSL
jgi:hypothetical protein